MPGNDLTVVSLLDVNGTVVGYAAGTAEEVAPLAAEVWPESDPVAQTAVEYFKDVMATKVKDVRLTAEADGVLIDGNLFSTTAEAQIKYLGSLVFATRDPNYSGRWETLNNGYVTLDSLGVYTVCSGIMTYLQNCAAWEQSLLADVAAATTVGQLQAIDFFAGKPQGSAGLPPPPVGTSEPPALESGSVNVSDVVCETASVSGLTTTGSLRTDNFQITTSFALPDIDATGHVQSTGDIWCDNTENTFMGMDSTGFSRFGFVKKSGTTPFLAAGTGTDIRLGHTSASNIRGNVGAATFTPRLTISSSTGGTTVLALDAGSGAIQTTGAMSTGTFVATSNGSFGGTLSVTGGTSVASLNAGSGTIQTTGAVNGGSSSLTGNQSIGGTLSVTGASTLASLGVTNNASIGGTLTSTGAATVASLNAGSGLVQTTGAVNAGSCTVTNSLTAGSLSASGANTLGSLAVTNNGSVGGTLTVTGGTSLSSTLGVTGAITGASLNTGAGTISTTGAVNGGSSAITANSTIGGTLSVTGGSTLASLSVTNNASVGGTLTSTGAATVASLNAGSGTVVTTGALNGGSSVVTGNGSYGGTLSVTGASTLASLGVTGNQTVGGTFTSTGAASTGALTSTGAIAAAGSISSTNTENVYMGLDSAGASRMGFAKKTGGTPVIAGGSAQNIVFGHFNVANLLGGIAAGTFTQRMSIAASNGAVAITGALTAAATTVASLTAGSGTIVTTGALNGGTSTVTGNKVVGGTLSVTGSSTMAAITATSLNAGSGSVVTTGALNGGSSTITGTLSAGATTVTSLNAGSGTISTTGALNGGSSTITGNTSLGGTLAVTGTASTGALTSTGAIAAAGSVSSTSTEDTFMGVDSAGSSRLGFVKKTAAGPVIAAGSAQDISIGHFSVANLLGGVGSGTYTQRLLVSASTGAVSVTNALSAASAAIAGSLTAGASTLASLAVTNNTVLTGTLTSGAATLASATVTNALSAASAAIAGTLTAGAATLASATVTNALSAASAAIAGTLTAGASTLASLDVTNNTVLTGTLSSGAATLASATVTNALSADSAVVTNGLTAGSVVSNGEVSAGGSISSTNTEDTYMGVDSAGQSRLGFVKQTGGNPVIAGAAGQNMSFGFLDTADLKTGVASGNYQQRLWINANNGKVTVTNTFSAGSSTLSNLTVNNNATVNGNAVVAGTLTSGPVSAAGSVASVDVEDTYMGVDSAGSSRLGFVKKTGSGPVLAAGSVQDISIGHFSVANLLGGVGAFTQRMMISASTGFVGIGTSNPSTELDVAGAVSVLRLRGGGATPAVTRLAGAGTTGVISLGANSSQTAGSISIAVSGTINATTDTPIARLTFPIPYLDPPFVCMMPGNSNAGALTRYPYLTTTTTYFEIVQSSTADLVSGRTYVFNYHVVG